MEVQEEEVYSNLLGRQTILLSQLLLTGLIVFDIFGLDVGVSVFGKLHAQNWFVLDLSL